MEQAILVYLDLNGIPTKVGQLWSHFRNGRESMSFEYDRNWLQHPKRFSLDPALKLVSGSFHTGSDKPLFGALDDSSPDRWGRLLMRRSERQNAAHKKRTARAVLRIGSYRFYFYSHEPNEPPHIHIDKNGSSAKFWLKKIALANNIGFAKQELNELHKLVTENQKIIFGQME